MSDTINDSIQNIVKHTLNQQPVIKLVTVEKIYEDHHIDVKTEDNQTLTYLPFIANDIKVGHKGLLIPLENKKFYVISK